MKDRIEANVKAHQVYSCNYKEIHVVDWKKFTNENLKIHECSPSHPATGKLMHSVCLMNSHQIEVYVDAFGENALEYSKKRRSKQCECVIFPMECQDDNWTLFIEMKYAEDEIAAFREDNGYPNAMIRQIVETVSYFRDKHIISDDKSVYAIVSFPNLISSFNSTLFGNDQINELYLDKGIIIRGTNKANIISANELELIG